MSHTKFVSVIASCLAIAAPAVLAGDPSNDAADRQQARDHAGEVRQLKDHTRADEEARRRQAEHDRQKLKEHKKLKEEAEEQAEHEKGLDKDDDGVDGGE